MTMYRTSILRPTPMAHIEFENNDIPLKALYEMWWMGKEHERLSTQLDKDPLLQMRYFQLPCNVNAKNAHNEFWELPRVYRIEINLFNKIPVGKTFEEINTVSLKLSGWWKVTRQRFKIRWKDWKSGFINEELSKELYEKHLEKPQKFIKEKKGLKKEMEELKSKRWTLTDGPLSVLQLL